MYLKAPDNHQDIQLCDPHEQQEEAGFHFQEGITPSATPEGKGM